MDLVNKKHAQNKTTEGLLLRWKVNLPSFLPVPWRENKLAFCQAYSGATRIFLRESKGARSANAIRL